MRFSDARDWRELARMLDEHLPRLERDLERALVPTALFEREARVTAAGAQVGNLVQATAEGMVRLATPDIPATGVVTAILAGQMVRWAPMAVVWCLPVGTRPAGLVELFLGDNGQMQYAAGTSRRQKAGVSFYRDGSTNLDLCFVSPEPLMGLDLALG